MEAWLGFGWYISNGSTWGERTLLKWLTPFPLSLLALSSLLYLGLFKKTYLEAAAGPDCSSLICAIGSTLCMCYNPTLVANKFLSSI